MPCERAWEARRSRLLRRTGPPRSRARCKLADLAHVARRADDLPAFGGKRARPAPAPKSRGRTRIARFTPPLPSIRFAPRGRYRSACAAAQSAEASRRQSRQRPHRHGAHQRGVVVEPRFDQRHERRIAGIAGGDQHIAHEAVAAGALDRRAAKAGAKRGIVEREQLGERRVVALGSDARAWPRARCCANLFHGQTARQSSQPKMRLPIAARNRGAMCPLCSMVR